MKRVRLFDSGGELPEEKVMALVAYLVKSGLLDPNDLEFSEGEVKYDLTLITPFGKVNFEANGDSSDHKYTGEGYWTGAEEFWRRLGGIDYYVWTSAVYQGRDQDDLTYLESKSVISIDSKPAKS